MPDKRRRRLAPPAILTCERCRTMFTLRLPICKCPEGPCIQEWAKANGWAD